ncbi:MAG TPA: hypothetical protein VF576_03790, partial [Rubricoccaceae bacterium]
GWNPDVIHAAGWIGSLVPYVLQHDPALAGTKTVYTPDLVEDFEPTLSAEEAFALGLPEALGGLSLRAIGLTTADAVAYAPGDGAGPGEPAGPVLDGDGEGAAERAADLYTTLRPALAA